jgi:N-methylhydantoinase B
VTFDIEQQVIAAGLVSAAEEMGARLVRAAYSANIKERMDCSAAVFTSTGELIAQAEHAPLHLGSLLGLMGALLAKRGRDDFQPGDAFIANDPYGGGGSHLPDISIVSPVFSGGQLIAFVATIGHHADGGNGHTSSIYDEGLRIPVVQLLDRGVPRADVVELILANFRLPRERNGDFRAQLGANAVGAERIASLAARYGRDQVTAAMQAQLDYSERMTRELIRALPDGHGEFEDVVDDDGRGTTGIPIRASVDILGDHVAIDFAGSSPQVPGDINSVFINTVGTVYYCVKALLASAVPPNAGFHRAIEVSAPEGSVVNCRLPAAVDWRTTTSLRIVDAVMGAFAQILSFVPAASSGSGGGLAFAGVNPATGSGYFYLEAVAGGFGAGPGLPGMDGTHSHISNSANLPVESLETEYPLLVEEYSLIRGSGGAGRWPGGMGLRRAVRVAGPSSRLVGHIDRVARGPWGLHGGEPGRPARLVIKHADGTVASTSPKVYGFDLKAGDTVIIETPGGGGYGPVKPAV